MKLVVRDVELDCGRIYEEIAYPGLVRGVIGTAARLRRLWDERLPRGVQAAG